jgi:hypothetical protein
MVNTAIRPWPDTATCHGTLLSVPGLILLPVMVHCYPSLARYCYLSWYTAIRPWPDTATCHGTLLSVPGPIALPAVALHSGACCPLHAAPCCMPCACCYRTPCTTTCHCADVHAAYVGCRHKAATRSLDIRPCLHVTVPLGHAMVPCPAVESCSIALPNKNPNKMCKLSDHQTQQSVLPVRVARFELAVPVMWPWEVHEMKRRRCPFVVR